jgi:hypothetical protein
MSSSDPPTGARVSNRFHGRVRHGDGRPCQWAGCTGDGEFKAPLSDREGYQWLCLEHVRAFNEAYDYFRGRSPEEVMALQAGHPSWERKTWPFASNGGGFGRAGDLHIADPLDILSGQPQLKRRVDRPELRNGHIISPKDKAALKVLSMPVSATPRQIKQRYKVLVRQYHPDSNGGDRSQEAMLHKVVEAYTHLAKSPAFAT